MASEWLGVIAIGGLVGMTSAFHCAAMCGPLAALATTSGGRPVERTGGLAAASLYTASLYTASRALGYAVAGGVAGGLGALVTGSLAWTTTQTLASWSLGVVMLGVAARLGGISWPGRRGSRRERLVPLRRSRAASTPLTSALREGRPAWRALLGVAHVLLPCGASWTALAGAAATSSATYGALFMTAFALASSPFLLFAHVAARWAASLDLGTRRGLALALALGAIVSFVRPLTLTDDGPHCHDGAAP